MPATRKNYELSLEQLALESPDPRASRLLRKNLSPGLSSSFLFSASSRPQPAKHDDELVAGVAHADVVRADGRAQHLGDLAQRAVADVVAVGVVDRP